MDEVWFSRLAQPKLAAWSAPQEPLRLFEKTLPPEDKTVKAIACYGCYLPQIKTMQQGERMWLRFVQGRPTSAYTCAFLEWLTQQVATGGKRVLVLFWDNATWHRSRVVQTWIKTHNQQVKDRGGVRLVVYALPVKSPWLNNIEPKWRHGKRAVVEPQRVLPAEELAQRLCAYYGCEYLTHLTP